MMSLRGWIVSFAVATSIVSTALPASAQQQPASPLRIDREIAASREISMEVGQNRLMEVSSSLGRVAVANPDVADLKVVTNNQLLLTAKGAGDTYLTLWDKQDSPLVMSLHVTKNLDALRKQLKDLFPDEKINVSAVGDLVVLSGDVSDVRVPERVLAVSRLHAAKIANQLRVPGNQQVQLEVKFAEVSRTALRQVGLQVLHSAGNRVAGMATPFQPIGVLTDSPVHCPNCIPNTNVPGIPAIYPGAHQSAFNLFFSGLSSFPFSAVLSLLEENQLAKTLAEPTLVAMTGQEAHFLAGGEFPIPIASTLGTVQVLFKKFGIQLTFTPTVLSDGLINLQLQSEVSEIDPSLAVQLGGFNIPGLSTRQSDSTVRLRDGQSFAIAGLLSDRTRSNVDKLPGLGDIPILGALFRSSSYQRDETELLVVITTHLVHPVGPKDAPFLPGGDELNDPDDFELFFLGKTGGAPSHPAVRGEAIPVPGHHSGGPAGEVGYMR